jgi:phenylpropionate dioxygenase-like ring-hydroxylating dioxygenase large terminal subunit
MPVYDLTRNELDRAGEARLYLALRHFWQPVMLAADLSDRPQRAELLGEQLVLVRMAGEIRCFADRCAHRGAALSLGWLEDDQIRCRYHGWTYGPDGSCTAIPARFGTVVPGRARLHSYLADERYGIVWVCLMPEPALPLPEFPEFGSPGYRVTMGPVYEWKSSAHRRVENFVDFAHFAWVHDGVLGSHENPEVEDHDVWRDGPALRFTRQVAEPVSGFTKLAADAEGWVDVAYDYALTLPLTVHFTRTTRPGGDCYVLMMSASPMGPKTTRSFWALARNYALEEADEEFVRFERLVQEQDRPVVESQRPELLPFDLSAELHIRGVDKVSVEYRRWLVELAKQLEPGVPGASPAGPSR